MSERCPGLREFVDSLEKRDAWMYSVFYRMRFGAAEARALMSGYGGVEGFRKALGKDVEEEEDDDDEYVGVRDSWREYGHGGGSDAERGGRAGCVETRGDERRGAVSVPTSSTVGPGGAKVQTDVCSFRDVVECGVGSAGVSRGVSALGGSGVIPRDTLSLDGRVLSRTFVAAREMPPERFCWSGLPGRAVSVEEETCVPEETSVGGEVSSGVWVAGEVGSDGRGVRTSEVSDAQGSVVGQRVVGQEAGDVMDGEVCVEVGPAGGGVVCRGCELSLCDSEEVVEVVGEPSVCPGAGGGSRVGRVREHVVETGELVGDTGVGLLGPGSVFPVGVNRETCGAGDAVFRGENAVNCEVSLRPRGWNGLGTTGGVDGVGTRPVDSCGVSGTSAERVSSLGEGFQAQSDDVLGAGVGVVVGSAVGSCCVFASGRENVLSVVIKLGYDVEVDGSRGGVKDKPGCLPSYFMSKPLGSDCELAPLGSGANVYVGPVTCAKVVPTYRSRSLDMKLLAAAAGMQYGMEEVVIGGSTRFWRMFPLKYGCELCPARFGSVRAKRAHLLVHRFGGAHTCVCGKSFRDSYNMRRHVQTVRCLRGQKRKRYPVLLPRVSSGCSG